MKSSAPPEAVAQLLERHGEDPHRAVRSEHGVSNETWVAENVVLRVAASPGPGWLSKEARIAQTLPSGVGYPKILEAGLFDNFEYLLAERLRGVNLGAAWRSLPRDDHVAALEDVWARLNCVHSVDVDRALEAGATSTPFYTLTAGAADRLLDELRHREAIDAALHRELGRILERGFDAMSLAPLALTHTDVHPGNVVWSKPDAILLDFEFACVAPVDLDLEGLCRHFLWSSDGTLASELRNLISDQLAAPGGRDRLRCYAVLFDVWALNRWLDTPEDNAGRGAYETWGPLVRLRGHVDGTGWLAQVV